TDRAHVMIAAALLGRQVEYASSSYHKVPAIADYALREHDVRPLRAGVRRRAARPQRSPEPIGPELARRLASAPGAQPEGSRRRASAGRRVTAIVVSASNPGHALASARALDGASVVLIDSNSSDRDAAALEAGAAKLANVELRRFDRELGTAGTRRLALEEATGELVLLLDEGVIPAPGMVEALAGELDREAEAMAVAATVLDLEGSVVSSGGWVRLAGGALEMTALGRGLQFDDERLPPSGPSGWLPSPAALVRRTLLDEHPPDPACGRYHDADWSQRVSAQRPAALRRSREALAVRCLERPLAPGGWEAASAEVDALVDHAAFYARHRLVLANDLEAILPGLTRDGELDVARARLLLELVGAKGAAWTHAEWLGGRLAPLIEHDGGVGEAEFDWLRSRAATLAAVERGGWWRLRGRLLPLLRIASRARGRGAA
ncbi:MAG TPA: glycosyltransferase family A protein, partial [Solirubrobacteraceae bacterium]|nr:glycosyltransferase family A protein [Solirubrobacteraceae bacterium]